MTGLRVLQIHARYAQRGGEDSAVEAEREVLRAGGMHVDTWIVDNADFAANHGPAELAARTLWNSRRRTELSERLDRDEGYDVAHVHNTFPSLSPSVFLELHRRGVPVVHTLHNFRTTCVNGLLLRGGQPCRICVGRAVPWPGVLHRCYRGSVAHSAGVAALIAETRALRILERAVDAFVALSEFSRAVFREAGLPDERIHVKPNVLADGRRSARRDGGAFLFVGRIAEEKGVATLLEAWSRLVDPPELHIVGDGPLRTDLQRRAPPSVSWFGTLDRPQVLDLMATAAALVVPSIAFENCPMTVIEAASVGLPAIVTGHGGMAEMVTDGHSGWHVAPGDPESLATVVGQANADPAARARYGRAARERFLRSWAPEPNRARLLDVYGHAIELAASAPRGARR